VAKPLNSFNKCRKFILISLETFPGLHFLFSGGLIWSMYFWTICQQNKFEEKAQCELPDFYWPEKSHCLLDLILFWWFSFRKPTAALILIAAHLKNVGKFKGFHVSAIAWSRKHKNRSIWQDLIAFLRFIFIGSTFFGNILLFSAEYNGSPT
jgi:hypothetical protein